MKALITRNMTVANDDGEAQAFEKSDTPVEVGVETYRRLNRAGAAVVFVEDAKGDEDGEDDKSLDKLNKTELLAKATELEIEIDPKWTKADLVDAIEKKMAETPDA